MNKGERKSDIVRRLVMNKEYKAALRLAKNFRIGIAEEDRAQMEIAYECMLYPDFYKLIDKDPEQEVVKGIQVVERLYGGGSK